MSKHNQQFRALIIVALGQFNPAIIQPFWLYAKGLIKESEANNSDNVNIVHSQITSIAFDWARIDVTHDRFTLSSSDEGMFEALKDLAVGIFSKLPETPIRAIGINHEIHHLIADEDKYYKFGAAVSPLHHWTELSDPKLLKVDFIEQKRIDKKNGHYVFSLSPSDKILPSRGIAININDHISFELKDANGRTFIKELNEVWDSSKERADKITDNVFNIIKSL